MSLANEIQIVRQTALLTQLDFASELKVSFSTVNRWEKGKSTPNQSAMRTLKSFCEERGIDFRGIEKEWVKRRIEDASDEQ